MSLHDEGVPLIPRKLFFSNPDRFAPKISPDGNWLAWQQPLDGVRNIWVAPVGDMSAARSLTRLKGRPPGWHDWSGDGRFVLYMRDENGDENARLFAVDVAGGAPRDLTPLAGVAASIIKLELEDRGKIIVGLNDRDRRFHDAWLLDVASGERTLLFENAANYGDLFFDHQARLRLAMRTEAFVGGVQIFKFEGGAAQPWRVIPFEESIGTRPLYFNRAGTHLLMLSAVGRYTGAVLRIDMKSDEETIVAEDADADICDLIVDARTYEVDAAASDPMRKEWRGLNPGATKALGDLAAALPGMDFSTLGQSEDSRTWLVVSYSGETPSDYHLFDRPSGKLIYLFSARPALKPFALSPMHAVKIAARDGLGLVSYFTLPPDESGARPRRPLPMVLLVHGGPWSRDVHGYYGLHQMLANRGYAVLSVNYRASRGFGKAFVNAGDREHAAKMHDDLIDAVDWAVREGIAQRDKIAIMGGSYGGYASFVGATFTPDVFCCAVPIVGITDLVTLMENTPPYWADFMEQFRRRYGDWTTEEGRAFLRSRSPLYKVDAIKKPMLIGHGANDVRCTLAQSDAIVAAMQAKGIPVTYVVYPDEGHGFAKPENNLAFYAMVEHFFARHLGGRAEPVGGDFKGSSHQIRAGAEALGL